MVIAGDLKSSMGWQPHVGSNPTPSALFYDAEVWWSTMNQSGIQVQKRFARPNGRGLRQHFKRAFSHIFENDEDAAVAAQIVQCLVFVRRARNFGKPQGSLIINLD